jgi:hypothetical protein
MSTDTIQEFILKDERNFHSAVSVIGAWARTREYIAGEFLKRLGAMVLKELPGWECEQGKDFFEIPWGGIFFYKPSWDGYWVCLQFVKLGEKIQFGVARTPNAKRPFSSELLEAVAELQPSAKPNGEWWEAHVFMQTPARNWQEPEVLWRLHTDPTFLSEVAEQMSAVAKRAEQILDRLTKKKS